MIIARTPFVVDGWIVPRWHSHSPQASIFHDAMVMSGGSVTTACSTRGSDNISNLKNSLAKLSLTRYSPVNKPAGKRSKYIRTI